MTLRISLRPIQITQPTLIPLTCRDCPLNIEQLHHPKMTPTGADKPVLYFLGEAPGRTEDEEGTQFVGDSGQIIRERIPSKWINKIRWNNCIRCRPENNRDPAPIELDCCRQLQINDIEQSKPKVIVGFGGVPLNWLLGARKKGGAKLITAWRGRKMPVKVGNHVCWFYSISHPAALLYARARGTYESQLGVFESDLKHVFDEVSTLPPAEVEDPTNYYNGIECVTTFDSAALQQVLKWLTTCAKLEASTLDIETSALRPYYNHSKFLSIAVGTYAKTLTFALEHSLARWQPKQLVQIYEALEAYLLAKGQKWAHFAKFEQEWMHWKYGPRIIHKVDWHDTAAAAHVIDERKGKALEDLTQLHFGFNVKLLSNLDTTMLDKYDIPRVLKYNGLDTKYQDAIRIILCDLLEQEGLWKVYERINRVTPSFTAMQVAGVHRNMPAVLQFSRELSDKKQDILEQIQNDHDVKRFIKIHNKFKPTSNPDLQKFFKEFLKYPHPNRHLRNFKYSLAEDILTKFEHPVAKLVLELRTTTGNLSKYVEPLLDEPTDEFKDGGRYVCDDGLLHASFSQLITSTARSACEDPPLQQWPKREHREIRRVIGAPTK